MQNIKYYYLLSGRLEADIRNYGKFFKFTKDYLNKAIITNNPNDIKDNAIVVTHGYLGISREIFINKRKDIRLLVLDNPMINNNNFDAFRIQDNDLRILEVPKYIDAEVEINMKLKFVNNYLKNLKLKEFIINKKKGLNINISFPHGELIKLISSSKLEKFNKKIRTMQSKFDLNMDNTSKKKAILRLDKYFLPSKYSNSTNYELDINNVPYYVFAFQSAMVHKFQLIGCDVVTSEYNPFHSNISWHKISLEERIDYLINLYIKKTFTGREFAQYIIRLAKK